MIIFSTHFTVVGSIHKLKNPPSNGLFITGTIILFGFITYILALRRFRVVYYGISHELLKFFRYTHESCQDDATDKGIKLVAKSNNAAYARCTMGTGWVDYRLVYNYFHVFCLDVFLRHGVNTQMAQY